MTSVEAVFTNGIFKPLGNVSIPENQRVRLSIEPIASEEVSEWLDSVRAFQKQLIAQHGIFPDSTAEIAADRRCHE